MAQMPYNQINEVWKASLFFSSKYHLFRALKIYICIFNDTIFVGFTILVL